MCVTRLTTRLISPGRSPAKAGRRSGADGRCSSQFNPINLAATRCVSSRRPSSRNGPGASTFLLKSTTTVCFQSKMHLQGTICGSRQIGQLNSLHKVARLLLTEQDANFTLPCHHDPNSINRSFKRLSQPHKQLFGRIHSPERQPLRMGKPGLLHGTNTVSGETNFCSRVHAQVPLAKAAR